VKTAISLPDELFARGEQFAERHRRSRSDVMAAALDEYLLRHGDESITARLNEVYDAAGSVDDDVVIVSMNREMAANNPW
jgi:predicted transcriptional regulator